MAEEIDLVQVSELQKLSDLDLHFGSNQSQTGVHIWSRSTHTKLFVDGLTNVRTDGQT